MNKPDWKDAPEWANWLAQDADGSWCWHEYPPANLGKSWSGPGRVDPVYMNCVGPKEPRPKPKVETIKICSSDRVSIIIGGCVRNFVDGPCTITITEP